LTIDATTMTAASAMTAIGRRLARRTGTVSTRNGGDVMATVCVWLSTLAGSRSGRRGTWMVGARYRPDSPTPASLASGSRAPGRWPRLRTQCSALLVGWDTHRGGRGQVATNAAGHRWSARSDSPRTNTVLSAPSRLGRTGRRPCTG